MDLGLDLIDRNKLFGWNRRRFGIHRMFVRRLVGLCHRIVQSWVELHESFVGGQSQHRTGWTFFHARALAVSATEIALVGAEFRDGQSRIRFKAQCAARTFRNAQAAANAALIIDGASFARILAHLDADGTIESANSALNAARRVGRNMEIGRRLFAFAERLRQNRFEETLALFMLARQQFYYAVWTRLHTFIAAATRIRHKRFAFVAAHSVEMTGVDARRVGTIAAHVGKLIATKARARHGHARSPMAILASCDARLAIDAFG